MIGYSLSARPLVIKFTYTLPDFPDNSLLSLPSGLAFGASGRSTLSQSRFCKSCSILTNLIARYNLPPTLTSGIAAVSKSFGGFAVVIKPPASLRMAMPAATSLINVSIQFSIRSRMPHHSQQPPSHQMSKDPIAVYARSRVALPKLLTP